VPLLDKRRGWPSEDRSINLRGLRSMRAGLCPGRDFSGGALKIEKLPMRKRL